MGDEGPRPPRGIARSSRSRSPDERSDIRDFCACRIQIPGIASLTRAAPSCLCRPLSIPYRKNIPLYRNSVSAYVSAILIRRKGRSYVVTSRGSGSGGRGSVVHERWEQGGINPVRSRPRADERRLKRTAKSRGPGCRCYSQALRRCGPPDRAKRAANSRGDGGKQELVSGESAPYAVKHRAGKAGRFRLHLSSVVHCVCILIARRTSGCQPAPGLPCALSL